MNKDKSHTAVLRPNGAGVNTDNGSGSTATLRGMRDGAVRVASDDLNNQSDCELNLTVEVVGKGRHKGAVKLGNFPNLPKE